MHQGPEVLFREDRPLKGGVQLHGPLESVLHDLDALRQRTRRCVVDDVLSAKRYKVMVTLLLFVC